jgi:hypothetical protein
MTVRIGRAEMQPIEIFLDIATTKGLQRNHRTGAIAYCEFTDDTCFALSIFG